MIQGDMLYEGKAKKIFLTDQPDEVVQYFKDDATAFNAQKKGTILEKGIVNNKISTRLFELLEQAGVATHFLKKLSDREMLARRVKILPIEVVIRNRATGSIIKRLGLEEGLVIDPPLIEFFYKDDSLGDPLITEDHIRMMNLATSDQVASLKTLSLKINEVLKPFFQERGMMLVDFKLEFGLWNGQILLADEISPDTCRFWDIQTGERMDKDRFRKDLGRIEETYQEVLRRVCA
ncbi:MAG: phosphoribosylaminoimidazolesuccinocarboxamide synthase [Nitrospira sp.]|nr:phosphoribosylaminoimidazolesuccinocarboxamide synthase [Nitrospira sp.]MCA9466075.1 phosphoribosylaminoimidazolesuccinocarboxamide synthase [Nitrospira sp.]MCA9477477.1 phosphoribosylaminoimidazolesuccinocarboxamide synthase [Nitrospira sp.]MCA9479725.1 phosphoribosylaminoimidazolesuccinocarboxamide synthase [Nitrospira sp.]MCB9711115.1 phosphoribosylaminoimidazolesuccinocarboxamide synthase [Nitrospiraceae bacterium]